MKISLTILLFFAFGSGRAQEPMPDSVRAYIDSAITIMRTKSLYGKQVDWAVVQRKAFAEAKDARTYKQAFPAIAFAFNQLKDHHGMVANEDTFYRLAPKVDFEKVLSPGIKKEFLKGNRIVADLSTSGIAYLRVPAMNVNRQKDIDLLANRLRDSLCVLLTKSPKGIVLDLRMNSGGNYAPMLAGLAPLFRQSIIGYGVDRDGRFLAPTTLRDGIVTDGEGTKTGLINNTCKPTESLPIAVLIGPSTVSSGEILSLYLRQIPGVRLIGQPTAGYCNATEGFLFMNNQGYLLLTVNKIADGKKRICNEMIVRPDVLATAWDNYAFLGADPTVQAAYQWLLSSARPKIAKSENNNRHTALKRRSH